MKANTRGHKMIKKRKQAHCISNLEMKKLLSQQQTDGSNMPNATPSTSPSKLFIDNVSPLAKKRATKRLIDKKEELSHGAISQVRRTLGINL
ncbi:unnamed protein product [Didymodactylos carnosus]|uniref:Uncharacterized protein n=1 Tax=Didymodactylos carnosus TaxID=1234261 RepID=A0A815KBJ6_9BILA|nr:unnamed protein product [Didymodactylos carnosus]CAF1393482.1 unnamed protein product [Didymodactylos carnosus]CAF4050219.1 unnamed protein product [Didymodactylos carnosus]CAF4287788.1 unnamed protein product [Didymodactylos carnosus]